jgi:hypothetical protein
VSNWHDMTPEERAAQLDSDYRLYGFSAFHALTGERVDPAKIKPIMEEHIMDEGDPFEGLGFNPSDFFKQIRRSASVKAGAIVFGQAQTAYYDTLKERMSDEEAFQLLAITTESAIRGLFSAVGPVSEVLLKAVAMSEYFDMLKPKDAGKQVPGDDTT